MTIFYEVYFVVHETDESHERQMLSIPKILWQIQVLIFGKSQDIGTSF